MSNVLGGELDRRAFLGWMGKQGLVTRLALTGVPALLSACGRGSQVATGASPGTPSVAASGNGARPLIGDVKEFELTSDDWEGEFGFVTFRLHRGLFDGRDVYFIRTDASDQGFASREKLLWVPRIQSLAARPEAVGALYVVKGGVDDQPAILSTQPGRGDYSPAWQVHEVNWIRNRRALRSADDVRAAERAGDVEVSKTNVVVNYPVVKWSEGEMPADTSERRQYLGPGQLLEPPNTKDLEATFKLHECFPNARYIVTDTSMAPMAEGMHVAHSPRLSEAIAAQAAGRVNVFMGGLKGPGPMGAQPSVFDSEAGQPQWSPYWEHLTYVWKEGKQARLLKSESEIRAALSQDDLDEFVGTPDTKGERFVVNCPVPVWAPNTFGG